MDIFNKIENFSYKISSITVEKEKCLTEKEKEEEKEIWDYFYFLIFSQLFTFFFVFSFGAILRYLDLLIFCLFSFCFLRTKSGGYHCDSFKKCFITSNISFILIGIISKIFYVYFSEYYILLFLFSMIGAIFIIPSCPLPWGNEESRGEEIDKLFQLQYRNRVIILYLLNIFLIFFYKNYHYNVVLKFIIGISFGMILASFTGSVVGSKFIENIWKNKK